MKVVLVILLQCYFALFPREADEAIGFIGDNAEAIRTHMANLSADERQMAMAIVAPEISQFSSLRNFMELRALFISYRNFGKGNFSIGYFQMKPGFVEGLEEEVRKNSALKRKYASYLPSGDEKEKRTARLERLSSIEWQLKYLQLFIEVVKNKTANRKFSSDDDKLRYWATLYNSGINSSSERVARMQTRKLFPRDEKSVNYSDAALEFYKELKRRNLKL